MSYFNNQHSQDISEDKLFISDNINHTIRNFIHHNFLKDRITSFGDIYDEQSLLCSHANTCKYRKSGETINSCNQTSSCKYFCQRFISVSYQKINSPHYQNLLEEANKAKEEKRLRKQITNEHLLI